jgi:ATP-dependent Clp protease ATP-binding subunit ClpC
VRKALAELTAEGPETDVPDFFPQTPPIKHVMKLAIEEARRLKSPHIGTEHLLLALLGEPQGVAIKALAALGIKPESVREKILAMLDEERRGAAGQS